MILREKRDLMLVSLGTVQALYVITFTETTNQDLARTSFMQLRMKNIENYARCY